MTSSSRPPETNYSKKSIRENWTQNSVPEFREKHKLAPENVGADGDGLSITPFQNTFFFPNFLPIPLTSVRSNSVTQPIEVSYSPVGIWHAMPPGSNPLTLHMRHYQEPMPIRSDRIIQITEKTDGNDARAGCWLDAGTPAFAGKSCRTGRRNQVSPSLCSLSDVRAAWMELRRKNTSHDLVSKGGLKSVCSRSKNHINAQFIIDARKLHPACSTARAP